LSFVRLVELSHQLAINLIQGRVGCFVFFSPADIHVRLGLCVSAWRWFLCLLRESKSAQRDN
jgi:hypothetical protein